MGNGARGPNQGLDMWMMGWSAPQATHQKCAFLKPSLFAKKCATLHASTLSLAFLLKIGGSLIHEKT